MKAGDDSREGGRMPVKWYRAPYKGETVSQSPEEELGAKDKSIIRIVVPESAETKKQTKRGKEK